MSFLEHQRQSRHGNPRQSKHRHCPSRRRSGAPRLSAPSYLYRHSSGYIFRIRIPYDIRPFLGGKTEFRHSLRTGALGEAKYRARVMAAHAQRTFRNIRNGGNMTTLTPDQIWDDIDLLEIPAKTTDEPRFLVIGRIGEKHWTGTITDRGDTIRIIAVRRARDEEIELYES